MWSLTTLTEVVCGGVDDAPGLVLVGSVAALDSFWTFLGMGVRQGYACGPGAGRDGGKHELRQAGRHRQLVNFLRSGILGGYVRCRVLHGEERFGGPLEMFVARCCAD